MKKILKIVFLIGAVIFLAIQFRRPDRTNPPENPADTLEARMNVPPEVKAVLDRSCQDCHTSRTAWPWYTNIAPVSWRTVDHVRGGQKELNFSLWGTYEPRRQRRKLHEICTEVESGRMPLSSYLIMHRDAKMSPQDIQTLCKWSKAEEEKLKKQLDAQPEPSPAQSD
jgi:hypothetical protein